MKIHISTHAQLHLASETWRNPSCWLYRVALQRRRAGQEAMVVLSPRTWGVGATSPYNLKALHSANDRMKLGMDFTQQRLWMKIKPSGHPGSPSQDLIPEPMGAVGL